MLAATQLKSEQKDQNLINYYIAFQMDETYIPTLWGLMAYYLEKKDYDLALKFINRAIQQDSRDHISWINKRKMLYELGKSDEAITCCLQGLSLINEENELIQEINNFGLS